MKPYVLDATALLGYLQHEASRNKVARLLSEALRKNSPLLVSAINWGEVFYSIWKRFGEDRARSAMQGLDALPIRILDADLAFVMEAAALKARHGIPYADSFALAAAIRNRATLVTSDSDFENLGRLVPILWLSGSGSSN